MENGTRMDIEAWQKEAGIKPPDPATCQLWSELQKVAFEAIKIAELEKSGIRDGDGYWHGSDVIGGILQDMESAVSRLKAVNEMPSNEQPHVWSVQRGGHVE